MEVELVLQGGGGQAGLGQLTALEVQPGLDQIVGEDVSLAQEVMVLLQGVQGLFQGSGARNSMRLAAGEVPASGIRMAAERFLAE